MKKVSKSVLFSLAMLTMVFSLALTSCSSDENDEDSVKITEENVVGTWANAEKNITLVVAEDGSASYTNDDYPDGKVCSWYISDWGWLDVSSGLFVKIFTLKSETELKDDSTGDILKKQ